MQYRDSRNPKVAAAGIDVCTGRKWSAARKLWVTEEWLKQRALVGMMAAGQSGLGCFPGFQIIKTTGKD